MTDRPAVEIPTLEHDPVTAIAYARRKLFPMTLSQKPNVHQQAEIFLSDAGFMTTPIPITNGHLDFFGDIQLENPPPGATHATPLSADSLLVQGENDQPLGVVFFARPIDQQETHQPRHQRLFPIRRDPAYIELKSDGVAIQDITNYFRAYPAFIKSLVEQGHLDIAPQASPGASLFYAWRYLHDHPEQKQRVYKFLRRKKHSALTTFLTTRGDPVSQDSLMEFFLAEADTTGHAFADQMLPWLVDVNGSAMNVASQAVGQALHKAVPLYKQILELPQRLVYEAATRENAYRNHPNPPDAQKARQRQFRADALLAAGYFRDYLNLLKNPDDFGYPINLDGLKRFQKYHDPSNQQSSAIFDAVARYFFRLWGKRQEKFAPYAGRVREITQQFYDRLPGLEDEANELTADTPLNRRQIRLIAQRLHDADMLPASELAVRSDGVRSGSRIDEPFYEFLTGVLRYQRVEYIGNDLVQHPNLPSFMTFRQGDAGAAMASFKDHFDFALTEWPGPPVDTLILTDVLDYFAAVSSTLKPGGVYILDLPFPHGSHSYAASIAELQAKAAGVPPFEPPGMMRRGFSTPAGAMAEKPFLILDLESVIHAAREAGLEVLNITPDPIQRAKLVAAIDADDSLLTSSEDCMSRAFYRTGSGHNRFRCVFVRAAAQEAEHLRRKLGTITSPASYGLTD